jgi:hypothetical protein
LNRTQPRLRLLTALAGLGLLAYGSYVLGQNSRRPLPLPTETHQAPALASKRSAPSSERPEVMTRSADGLSIRTGLFSPPDPPAEPPRTAPAPPKEIPRAPTPPVVAADTVDPLADYVYNAVMTADGERIGVIEHRKSKQGWLVKEGETWLNYHIISVTDKQIKILADGQERSLLRSDAINLVPLLNDGGKAPEAPKSKLATRYAEDLAQAYSELIISRLSEAGGGLSAKEIARIKDDAFEGRITGAEAQRRLKQGGALNNLKRGGASRPFLR